MALIFGLSTINHELSTRAHARSGDGGANTAEFLRLGTGARAPAMGDAWTGAAAGVMALHYNPAGLGGLDHGEIEGMYQKYVMDIGHGTLGFAQPLGSRGGWGASLSYLDYGSTNRTTVSTVGGVATLSPSGTFGGHDLAAALSYGWREGAWGYGASAKLVSSRIDNASASAFAADFGVQWRSTALPLQLGLAAENLGMKMKFDRTGDHLSTLVRLGASYAWFDERLRVNTDLEKTRRGRFSGLAGVEYWAARGLALRAGYDGRCDIANGWTLGLGARVDALGVDYAFVPFSKFGNNHRLAINYRFGGREESRH